MRAFLLGVLAGYGIAIPVGAIAVMIVQVGIKCGFWCGACAGAGAATADLAYAGVAVAGGVALSDAVAAGGRPFRILSASVLAFIALRGLYNSRRGVPPAEAIAVSRNDYAVTYFKFLGLTIINPLTVVYFAAVVLGLGLAEDIGVGGAVPFVIGAFLASLSWQTLLAGVGAVIRHRLPRRFQVLAVVVGNLVIIAMAVLIVAR